jgi:hypothetical protein
MESKKSQGRFLTAIAVSIVLSCAALFGVAYFLEDDAGPQPEEKATPATSSLRAMIARCDEKPIEETVDGRKQTRCTSSKHPAFMIAINEEGARIHSASMLVPTRGATSQVLERTLLGLEMFEAVAGTRADAFLPKEYVDAIGTRETRLAFEGRVYVTQPVANVGLIFLVTPERSEVSSGN